MSKKICEKEEFLAALNLIPIRSHKIQYRRSFKERLRPSTKEESISVLSKSMSSYRTRNCLFSPQPRNDRDRSRTMSQAELTCKQSCTSQHEGNILSYIIPSPSDALSYFQQSIDELDGFDSNVMLSKIESATSKKTLQTKKDKLNIPISPHIEDNYSVFDIQNIAKCVEIQNVSNFTLCNNGLILEKVPQNDKVNCPKSIKEQFMMITKTVPEVTFQDDIYGGMICDKDDFLIKFSKACEKVNKEVKYGWVNYFDGGSNNNPMSFKNIERKGESRSPSNRLENLISTFQRDIRRDNRNKLAKLDDEAMNKQISLIIIRCTYRPYKETIGKKQKLYKMKVLSEGGEGIKRLATSEYNDIY